MDGKCSHLCRTSIRESRKGPAALSRTPLTPQQRLFALEPSGRRYRSVLCRTLRPMDRSYSQAIRLINRSNPLPLPPRLSTTLYRKLQFCRKSRHRYCIIHISIYLILYIWILYIVHLLYILSSYYSDCFLY